MLKGELGEETAIAIATIIFVTTILVCLGIIGLMLLNVEASVKTIREDLDVIDVSHIIKSCLSAENVILMESITEGNKIKSDSVEVCGFTGHASVKIKDIETGNIWEYGRERGLPYTLYVTVMVNGERHMGEMNVTYKA